MNIFNSKANLFPATYVYWFVAIIIFSFVLFPISQVNAEGAWVKWEQTTYCSDENNSASNWQLQEAFPA